MMLGSGAGSVLVVQPLTGGAFFKLGSRECEGTKERNVFR